MKKRRKKSFPTLKDINGFLKFEYPEREYIGFTEGFYCYFLTCPIDMGWEFLQKASDFADKLSIESEHDRLIGWLSCEEFTNDLRIAKKLLNENGFFNEIYLLWFPEYCCLKHAFITKGDENGTTVIISKLDLEKWGLQFLDRY